MIGRFLRQIHYLPCQLRGPGYETSLNIQFRRFIRGSRLERLICAFAGGRGRQSLLYESWFGAVEGACKRSHCFILWRGNETRCSQITFTTIEQRQETFRICHYHHLQDRKSTRLNSSHVRISYA